MKVITFSRYFPKGHPKAGQPTNFVEKIWKGLSKRQAKDDFETNNRINEYMGFCEENNIPVLSWYDAISKHHTIRAGNRWKVGEWFSPRVWSDKPYRSKQIEFSPPLQIKKIWDFTIEPHKEHDFAIHINDHYVADWKFKTANIMLKDVAKNDGLSKEDFIEWFDCKKNPDFIGQIICWNEKINYH